MYDERTAGEPLANRRSPARGAITMIQLNMFGGRAKGIFRSSCVEGGNGSRLAVVNRHNLIETDNLGSEAQTGFHI